MPATLEARARTRAFSRVIGPFLVIVLAIIALRAPDGGAILSAFFENRALVWITGGTMLLGGLLIIAHHQYLRRRSSSRFSAGSWRCAA